MNDRMPECISDFCIRVADTSLILIKNLLQVLSTRFGDSSVSGATAWSNLPENVKNVPSLGAFKLELKRYLFKQSYYCHKPCKLMHRAISFGSRPIAILIN